MKKITCYDCDETFQGEATDEVLKQMHGHYMSEHKEIITTVDEAGKKAWMERFHRDWEVAPEAE